MPTTEIAVFPLKAGADIGDPHNYASGIVRDTFDTLRTIDGMRQINFGTHMETPSNLQLIITWDSINNHHDFMKSSTYGPFLQRFTSMVDGEPTMMHVELKPEAAFPKVLSAPATEIATFYFDGEPPSDYLDNVAKCAEALRDADGYLDYAVGITHETLEKEGVKGKAAVLLIGWQSREAHMAFRETQSFKDNIHLLRSTSKKITMWHVQFMESQA